MRKYECGSSKRKKAELRAEAVKKTKSITNFLIINSPNEPKNNNAALDDQSVRPGPSTECHTPKLNDYVQLEKTDEPEIQNEADVNNNEKRSEPAKVPISQIDIGLIDKRNKIETNSFLKCQDFEIPIDIPKDKNNHSFPIRLFKVTLTNGEVYKRDWMCWSKVNQSLYCAPCFLLFNKDLSSVNVCLPLIDHPGWNIEKGWRKLKDKIPNHEVSNNHKENYIKWKEAIFALMNHSSIGNYIVDQIKCESNKWKKILHPILDIILFFV